jgi:hypothetical protein
MSALKITIHTAGSAICSLSGKDADGVMVTFDDGTVTEQHLSWKSLKQLIVMKAAKTAKPEAEPATAISPNGPSSVASK